MCSLYLKGIVRPQISKQVMAILLPGPLYNRMKLLQCFDS